MIYNLTTDEPLSLWTVYINPELAELIPYFVDSKRSDVDKIYSSLEKSNTKNIEFIGHNLSGEGSSYGFDYLSEIGCLLEVAAKADDISEILYLTKKLSDYLYKVKIVFQ